MRNKLVSQQAQRLDVVQGASEARTEPYLKYGEGVLELATQQCAKSLPVCPALPGNRADGAEVVYG